MASFSSLPEMKYVKIIESLILNSSAFVMKTPGHLVF